MQRLCHNTDMGRQRPRSHLSLGIGALALLLGLAGLAWWTGRARLDAAGGALTEDARRATADARVDSAAVGAPEAGTDAAEAAVRDAVAAELAVAQEASVPPRRTSGLRVRVLRRDTLEPVANLPVRAYDTFELSPLEAERSAYVDPDPLARFERIGVLERSDAQGELYLPRPRGRLQVLASANGLHGEAQWRASSEEPALLYVRPARSLEVVVRDARGEAVEGAPIAIRARLANERRLLHEGRTARQSDGRVFARVLALDPLFERVEGFECCVGLGFPTQTPVEQPLDPEALPSRVELVLPDTGALRVRLLDEVGQPIHLPGIAQLALDGKSLALGPSRARADTLRYASAFDDGEFVLRPVPLGERFSVRVQCDGFPRQTLPVIDGPRAAGEEVLLEYRFQKRAQVLTGRVVDAAGIAQAERAYQVYVLWPQVQRNDGWRLDSALVTDAEGRYRYAPRNGFGNGARELLLIDLGPRRDAATAAALEAGFDVAAVDADEPPGSSAIASAPGAGQRSRRSGRVALPDPTPPAEVPLADVVMGDELARGQGVVVDEAGDPIRGARVWLEQPRIARDEDDDTPRVQYESVGDGGVTTDERGEFTLFRIDGLVGPLYIRADKEGYLQSQRQLFDASGARVVLSSGGALVGRVLLTRDVARERLEARLRAAFVGAERSEPREFEVSLETDGRFRARGLESGAWDFTLALEGTDRPLFEARGVLVEAGQTSADERLAAIDLRELVRGYTLTVLAPDGERVGDGRVAVLALERGENATSTRVELRGGRARVATAAASLDVEVSARGYRPLRLLGMREDRTVRLEAGLQLRLRLARPQPIEPGRRFQAAVSAQFDGRAEDEIPAWAEDGEWLSFDERGEAVCALPAAGKYSVRVWSWSDAERGAPGAERGWLSLGPQGAETPWEIALHEVAGEQLFDLRPGSAPDAADATPTAEQR